MDRLRNSQQSMQTIGDSQKDVIKTDAPLSPAKRSMQSNLIMADNKQLSMVFKDIKIVQALEKANKIDNDKKKRFYQNVITKTQKAEAQQEIRKN